MMSLADEPVLVIDDDEQVRTLLIRLLDREGYRADAAADAEEARTLLERSEYALAVCDVGLPGESGLTLVQGVRRDHPTVATLMISGHDDRDIAGMALAAGAYGYITKPFRGNDVSIAVANALRRRRLELQSKGYQSELEQRVLDRTTALREALARLEVSAEESILRLSRAVEYRDPETGDHIERMSEYCGVLAGSIGLDAEAVKLASRLHDVGKIGVSDAVLLKPGPLTADERVEVERHADIGHELLTGSRSDVLELASRIAWTHHERWDGTGYPRGIGGEEIPLEGRIAAVADAFDAMSSDRVYRRARPFDEAVAIIAGERGKQFDPVVVDAFLENVDEVRTVALRLGSAGTRSEEDSAAEATLTLSDAATTLNVSRSTLRRWADDGRIGTVRTAGGHRRFSAQDVRRLAGTTASDGPAVLRPVDLPFGALQPLSAALREHGATASRHAAGMIYEVGGRGWLGSDDAAGALDEWIDALSAACESGNVRQARDVTLALLRRADLHGASLLERHRFVEAVGQVLVRLMAQANRPAPDVNAARRLFVFLAHAVLAQA
jgi:putative two-component system response regulator